MGNNNHLRSYNCATLFSFGPAKIIIFWLLITNVSYAQNISKYYTSSRQENGILYYLSSQNKFTNKIIKSYVRYDVTYLTANDTAVFNFSYINKSITNIDSILFIQGNNKFPGRTTKIFIEPRKTEWEHRYSAKFSFDNLNLLFGCTEKPQLLLFTKSGIITHDIKNAIWKKQSEITVKIFTMIKFNKQK